MTSTAKIVTTTHKVVTEVPEDRVHLDLSVQEAHYVMNLLGSSHPSIAVAHGLKIHEGLDLFEEVNRALGSPARHLYPQIDVVRF